MLSAIARMPHADAPKTLGNLGRADLRATDLLSRRDRDPRHHPDHLCGVRVGTADDFALQYWNDSDHVLRNPCPCGDIPRRHDDGDTTAVVIVVTGEAHVHDAKEQGNKSDGSGSNAKHFAANDARGQPALQVGDCACQVVYSLILRFLSRFYPFLISTVPSTFPCTRG